VSLRTRFVKGRTTVFNLTLSFLKSIEGGDQVDSIHTDFSKVFNRVRHSLLLDKMSSD
jgi:hypothetical protein